jgi:mono/diheme cytochrome c family protein
MRRLLCRTAVVSTLLAGWLASGACNKARDNAPAVQGPPGAPGESTPIREIMNKLTKGPQSLTMVIGQELKADSPPWDKIGPQAKEFAELAASMSKYDPPKGSKESWAKLTTAYAGSAVALDRAAQAKDKEAAKAAHHTLAVSCQACHAEHRSTGLRPSGGFPPPGGPVPGGSPPR